MDIQRFSSPMLADGGFTVIVQHHNVDDGLQRLFRTKKPSNSLVLLLVKKRKKMCVGGLVNNTMHLSMYWPKLLCKIRELERAQLQQEKLQISKERKGMKAMKALKAVKPMRTAR